MSAVLRVAVLKDNTDTYIAFSFKRVRVNSFRVTEVHVIV